MEPSSLVTSCKRCEPSFAVQAIKTGLNPAGEPNLRSLKGNGGYLTWSNLGDLRFYLALGLAIQGLGLVSIPSEICGPCLGYGSASKSTSLIGPPNRSPNNNQAICLSFVFTEGTSRHLTHTFIFISFR